MLRNYLQSRTDIKHVIWCVIVLFYPATAYSSDENLDQDTAVYSALSMGTAWALTHRHVVTNYHVINGMRNLRLVTSKQKEVPVEVVLVDEKNDLAVLFIKDENIRINPLPLALTKPRLGSHVFTIGYPHPNLMGTSPKLTHGLINATNGLADDPRTFQVSVPVQSGNSGGPLLNMRGEVVGIITSKLSAQKMFEWTGDIPQNVNYAIKVNRLSSLISELETDEQVKAGGVSKNQNLESLADQVVDSVIIVAGDGNKLDTVLRNTLFSKKQKDAPTDVLNEKSVIVYSYAEPGGHDLKENIQGSDSVRVYSKNSANVLKQHIQKSLSKVKIVTKTGKEVRNIFYRLENINYSKSLCNKHNASHIIASQSEDNSGQGMHFRYISYRLFDCTAYKDYKKQYTIERDELHDRFGYEVALHTTFKDFVLKTPPYISWVSQ